jgi:hypothetical protein
MRQFFSRHKATNHARKHCSQKYYRLHNKTYLIIVKCKKAHCILNKLVLQHALFIKH